MLRLPPAAFASLFLAAPAFGQLPPLRSGFGAAAPAQSLYQSGVTQWAGQLAGELASLRGEIGGANYPIQSKVPLARLADQAAASAEQFRRLAATTADRARLYPAHEAVGRAAENLAAAIDRVGFTPPAVAAALARARYADSQLHAALTGGDADPAVQRGRAVRLARTLDGQAEHLRDLCGNLPGADRTLDRAVRGVAFRADRLRRALDDGATLAQARPPYADVVTAWRTAATLLAAGAATAPAVRVQAARVGSLVAALGEAVGNGPVVLPLPLPDTGFLRPGSVFAVGAGTGGGPRVRVLHDLRGTDGTDFFAYDPGFRGGVRVAVADLTGDGVPDLVTAPGPGMPPLVRVFDGRTMALVSEFLAYAPAFTGGVFVAAADRSPAGRATVVTGADAGGGPQVKAFDLATGRETDSFFAFDEAFRGGVRVALGDVNGDGVPDIIAAAGPGGGPAVKVFDGRNRAVLAEFFAFDPADRSGVFVAAGDVTRNRRAEVVAAADGGGPPRVRVFDVLRGQPLGEVLAFPAGFRGGVRVATYDVNGDGVPDIVCGPGPGMPGTVRAFDGRDRTPLGGFLAVEANFRGGVYVGGR